MVLLLPIFISLFVAETLPTERAQPSKTCAKNKKIVNKRHRRFNVPWIFCWPWIGNMFVIFFPLRCHVYNLGAKPSPDKFAELKHALKKLGQIGVLMPTVSLRISIFSDETIYLHHRAFTVYTQTVQSGRLLETPRQTICTTFARHGDCERPSNWLTIVIQTDAYHGRSFKRNR